MARDYTGAAVTLGTLTAIALVVRFAKGSSTPSTTTRGAPLLVPTPSASPMYGRAPVVAERIVRMWQEASGESAAPTPAMLEILLSQAALESGIAEPGVSGDDDTGAAHAFHHRVHMPAAWGLLSFPEPEPIDDEEIGWSGAMRGSGNLGARQCDQSEQSEGGAKEAFYTCELAEDSKPNDDGTSTKFAVRFRYYRDHDNRPAGDWAAYDFVRSIARQRPQSFAALKSGSVENYAAALYKEHYYGGFGATPEERIAGYVKAIRAHLPAVAAALGHERVFAT